MNRLLRRLLYTSILVVCIAGAVSLLPASLTDAERSVRPHAPQLTSDTPPTNVVLMIGDGMGPEQVKAAGMYANGAAGTLSFEGAPYRAEVTTHAADATVTDSAASATAMATGYKVDNGVISMQYPGDGSELTTLLEHFRERCKRTGLVTTSYVTHATPAAFGTHEPNRGNYAEIAADYLTQTRPTVILGGGGQGMSVDAAVEAGYTVVTDRIGLEGIDPMTARRTLGHFGEGHMAYEYDYTGGATDFYATQPHLDEMTAAALEVLEEDPDGFFLMVEGARIDHAGHANHLERNVFETLAFADAVDVVLEWANDRDDTLVIVTADHETGGLTVVENNGEGNFPTVTWSTTGHTSANVPVYAWGPNAHWIAGAIDNTTIYHVAVAGSSPSGACSAHSTYLPLQQH